MVRLNPIGHQDTYNRLSRPRVLNLREEQYFGVFPQLTLDGLRGCVGVWKVAGGVGRPITAESGLRGSATYHAGTHNKAARLSVFESSCRMLAGILQLLGRIEDRE